MNFPRLPGFGKYCNRRSGWCGRKQWEGRSRSRPRSGRKHRTSNPALLLPAARVWWPRGPLPLDSAATVTIWPRRCHPKPSEYTIGYMRFHSRWMLPGCVTLALACAPGARAESPAERGKYLVEGVAQCGDCHTPAGEKGVPDRARWLKGATLTFGPLQPVPGWRKAAPDLTPAGALWKNWGEKGLVKFLTTGLGPAGHPADPPMPAYKMKPEDAQAVVAYLKSLK